MVALAGGGPERSTRASGTDAQDGEDLGGGDEARPKVAGY